MLKVSRSVMVLGLAVALLGFMVSGALADETASATKKVQVRVLPNIGVGASSPEPAQIQTGRFTITVPFHISANSQFVKIEISASHLFKAHDPASTAPPIMLDTSRPAAVVPAAGNENGGAGDNRLAWVEQTTISDFPGWKTEVGTFESSQPGFFNQDVMVTVTWNQANPDQPVGDYSGYVRLTAML